MNAVPSSRKRGARAEVPVTREAIVDAAFARIEEHGYESFSMRGLAVELGVFPATLYWHVGDRGQLLGMVEEKWTLQVELPDELADWREWMKELGRRYRRNAFKYPHVARLMTVERVRNINALRIPDAVLAKIVDLGLGTDMVHAYNALVGAVQGFVVVELARINDPSEPSARATESEMRSLDPERFPAIAANIDLVGDRALSVRWTDGLKRPLDDSFEFLLSLIVDGLQARVERAGS